MRYASWVLNNVKEGPFSKSEKVQRKVEPSVKQELPRQKIGMGQDESPSNLGE